MPNNLASFAIHADNVQRCRRFYESVFGWSFEPWGPPDFYLIHTGTKEAPGVMGLMHARSGKREVGAMTGFECTFQVDDLDAVTKSVAEHGGRILMANARIPTVGILTKFEDTEGNVLGAMRYETPPRA